MIKPDIIQTMGCEGVEVKHNKAHCPFHEDDTPSLMVYPKTNSYWCFGCNVGGDSIDFIMRHRGLTYKQAIAYLGCENRTPCKRDIEKRRLIARYKAWERDYQAELACLYRTIQHHKHAVWTMDDINAEAYHAEAGIEYRLDVLNSKDRDGKLGLYKHGDKAVMNGC